MPSESVLCVRRDFLEERLYRFDGFTSDRNIIREIAQWQFLYGDAEYISRDDCEEDPSWRQLIPYMLVIPPSNGADSVLVYRRTNKAGENRLHGRNSVGIGGHINQADRERILKKTGRESRVLQHLAVGAQRELNEELNIEGSYSFEFLGLLNEETDPVGSVHLGIVLLVRLKSRNVSPRGDDMTDVRFVSGPALFGHDRPEVHDAFEKWSRRLLTGSSIFRDGRFMQGERLLWDQYSFSAK